MTIVGGVALGLLVACLNPALIAIVLVWRATRPRRFMTWLVAGFVGIASGWVCAEVLPRPEPDSLTGQQWSAVTIAWFGLTWWSWIAAFGVAAGCSFVGFRRNVDRWNKASSLSSVAVYGADTVRRVRPRGRSERGRPDVRHQSQPGPGPGPGGSSADRKGS